MHVQHKEGNTRGKFFIANDNNTVAEIMYTRASDDILIIEHTEVDERFRDQNIGYELVHKTADYARRQGLKIDPVCPFARAIFDKTPEWKDLLA